MINEDARLPQDILHALPGSNAVLKHGVEVDAARWRAELSKRGLPTLTGMLGSLDRVSLTRRDVFEIGDREPTPDNAFQLFYYSLSWGLGLKAPRLHHRLDNFASHREEASELLVSAWNAARSGEFVKDAFSILTTEDGAGRIPWFGPAFSTKFLYFAQGAAAEPKLLNLDRDVAANLARDAWPDATTDVWVPEVYEQYCTLLGQWAEEASADSSVDREVRADEIELAVTRRA
ncbi:hypothetical protein [Nesterenkonia lutea]|uniref:Uncharacterized protein n=1 Tax=Nesterenkonia lutea TaxID=272919 RepID=A0ABR9JEV6_9MICC|nr:hypothetical protein [Nesterenkonia lutea]MBE1524366.1 hypothetical protein [Nesterenkonia lutea]